MILGAETETERGGNVRFMVRQVIERIRKIRTVGCFTHTAMAILVSLMMHHRSQLVLQRAAENVANNCDGHILPKYTSLK